jgi:adenosylcobinamide hydrolase
MFEVAVQAGVCRVGRPGTRWLVTGPNGGYRTADAAYNVTVPEGFDRTDLAAYGASRRREAGFDDDGPTLLTGVDMSHARGARRQPAVAVATVGLSNPVSLGGGSEGSENGEGRHAGTVNLIVGTSRSLADGALGTLLATAVEVKAATLQATTGFTGTTSDAVAVGCDPAGESSAFAGSATPVGRAARVCVRAAVRDAIDARGDVPASVGDAEHGTSADDDDPERFRP